MYEEILNGQAIGQNFSNEFIFNNQVSFESLTDMIRSQKGYEASVAQFRRINKNVLFNSRDHGLEHNERVFVYVLGLSAMMNLKEEDRYLLVEAAKYHDIGRTNDLEDETHGPKAAYMLREQYSALGEENRKTLLAIIMAHSMDDSKASQILQGYKIENQERALNLIKIFKDADALDRVRHNDLDTDFLRTAAARSMVAFSHDVMIYYEEIQKVKMINK